MTYASVKLQKVRTEIHNAGLIGEFSAIDGRNYATYFTTVTTSHYQATYVDCWAIGDFTPVKTTPSGRESSLVRSSRVPLVHPVQLQSVRRWSSGSPLQTNCQIGLLLEPPATNMQ